MPSPNNSTNEMPIQDVAHELGFTIQYVRYLIREGKLSSTLRPIFEGASTLRHMISREELDRYKSEAHSRSKREDKRNKFVFYATLTEYEAVLELVRQAGYVDVAESMLPANTIKSLKFLRTDGGGKFVK